MSSVSLSKFIPKYAILFIFLICIFIEVYLINNVVRVSDVQQSNSVIQIHVSILF